LKKIVLLSAGLTVLDQGLKLLIANNFMGNTVVLIPGVLQFRPVQNTQLTWIASMLDFQTPVIPMIIVQLLLFVFVTLFYRYSIYLPGKHKGLMSGYLAALTAGICCSFIDVVFWGGSIDFLRLFDWFTFDLKDVYLFAGSVFLIAYYIFYIPVYIGLSKEERNERKLFQWIKRGCPLR
jgi:signal peptidase II